MNTIAQRTTKKPSKTGPHPLVEESMAQPKWRKAAPAWAICAVLAAVLAGCAATAMLA